MANAFFEQEKICPICKEKFKITRVRSSACFVVKRESDYNVIYRDVNPIHYAVWVCPACQYAAPDNHFEDELRPAELERLKKGLTLLKSDEPDLSGERTPEKALRAYELALRTVNILKASPGLVASLYLRAAWVCRQLEKTELELKYLEEALKFYKESYEKEVNTASRLSDSRLMYIIGELNRRLGNYDIAVQWFSRAVTHPEIKKEPDLERLLRDQWELARQQSKHAPSTNDKEHDKEITQSSTVENTEAKDGNIETPAPPPKPKYRPKVKMYASVYSDQVEWLKRLSNICHEKTGELLGKETVLRAVIDVIMEINPDIEGCESEEQLTEQILKSINSKLKQ